MPYTAGVSKSRSTCLNKVSYRINPVKYCFQLRFIISGLRDNAGNKLLSNLQQIIKRVQIFRISSTCLFRFIELLLGRLDSWSAIIVSTASGLLLRLSSRLSRLRSCFRLLLRLSSRLSRLRSCFRLLAIDLFFGLA